MATFTMSPKNQIATATATTPRMTATGTFTFTVCPVPKDRPTNLRGERQPDVQQPNERRRRCPNLGDGPRMGRPSAVSGYQPGAAALLSYRSKGSEVLHQRRRRRGRSPPAVHPHSLVGKVNRNGHCPLPRSHEATPGALRRVSTSCTTAPRLSSGGNRWRHSYTAPRGSSVAQRRRPPSSSTPRSDVALRSSADWTCSSPRCRGLTGGCSVYLCQSHRP